MEKISEIAKEAKSKFLKKDPFCQPQDKLSLDEVLAVLDAYFEALKEKEERLKFESRKLIL